MANRLSYALPIARHLLRDTATRLRGNGLAPALRLPPGAPPFIIVTGTGRSGTSAVARVLHESGLAMGRQFDRPTDFNATGYYEDVALKKMNERIVAALGLSIRSPAWPWRSGVLAVCEPFAAEMDALAAQAPAGWKDPYFSLTLEPWLRRLRRRPKVVLCLRGPEAYAESLIRVYGLVDRADIERWWANELRRLDAVIRDYRLETLCIEYDRLVQHPEETVATLAAFVGHPLDAQYIDVSLRHFAHALPERHRRLYQRLRALGLPPGQGEIAVAEAPPQEPVQPYIERVRAIEDRLAVAKAAWTQDVGMPEPRLLAGAAPAQPPAEVLEETRSASAAYVGLLSEAQLELAAREPPAAFARYHELLRSAVDYERLAAQLLVRACPAGASEPDRAGVALSVTAWRKFCAPETSAQRRQERAHAYERALREAD